MIAIVAALLALQASPDHEIVCLADPATGDVEVTAMRRGDDGGWRINDGDKWVAPDLDRRPEAAGLDWYEAGSPIVVDGVTYLPGEPFSVGGAVNRYFRHVGLHAGAPLFSVWPGGDVDLAVLVRQEGCVFRVYGREDRSAG